MSKNGEQLEKEIKSLKDEVSQLATRKEALPEGATVESVIKYMVSEREKTNRLLQDITSKIEKLEKELDGLYADPQDYEVVANREVPLSALDARILDFVQSRGMICADDLMLFQGYKGRNAACTRLNKLYMKGILERYQLGHKVFYKFDAGKTTNTLIISPPQ